MLLKWENMCHSRLICAVCDFVKDHKNKKWGFCAFLSKFGKKRKN